MFINGLIFLSLLWIPLITRGYALANLIEVIVFLSFLFYGRLRQCLMLPAPRRILVCILAFYCWILVSGFWGNGLSSAVLEVVSWRKLLLIPIFIILLSINNHWRSASFTFISVGVLFLTIQLTAIWFGFDVIFGRPPSGVLQDHIAQSLFFVITALLLLELRREASSAWASYFFAIVSVAFLISVLVVGNSGTGLGVSIYGVVLWIWSVVHVRNSTLRGVILAGGLALSVGLICWFALEAEGPLNREVNDLIEGFSYAYADRGGEGTSVSYRFVMWLKTLEMLRESWFIGVGAGNFEIVYSQISLGQQQWKEFLTDDPHNQFLHIWAGYGVVGLVLFLSIFAAPLTLKLGGIERKLVSFYVVLLCAGLLNGILGGFLTGRILIIWFSILVARTLCARGYKLGRLDEC